VTRFSNLRHPFAACQRSPICWALLDSRWDGGWEPDTPAKYMQKNRWLVRMAERHWWFRVLLHLYMLVRHRRNVRWHLNCAWREIYECFHYR
jgi:hypothetical protein